ncbi:hypothetical protein F5144DRAFT_570044 [Chaetomium tenue]|uniref:Uncharacterized protein n=1 Tax=Chaetomium tenue TaxID=1854479 RepID=A0ACB7PG13_9PEZI|nr:hypothetical protein F5144DRAFT_570044 [Chaetomium globosum]
MMHSESISRPHPTFLTLRHAPKPESEDIEANVASENFDQPPREPFNHGLQTPDRSLLPRSNRKEPTPPIAEPRRSSLIRQITVEGKPKLSTSRERKPRRPLPQAWDAYGIEPPSGGPQDTPESVSVAEDSTSSGPDNKWVFLCYGNRGQGIAYPVPLEAFDAETQWRQLRDAWYAKRGHERLRRLLHPLGFGVNKIERVTIHKQGLPLKPDGGWDIAYETFDLASKVRLLREENLAAKRDILQADGECPDYIDGCNYGPDGVLVLGCRERDDDDHDICCPEEDVDDHDMCCDTLAHFHKRVEIGELQMVPRYAQLLQNPKYAGVACGTLPWKLIYTQRHMAQQLQQCEDVGLSAVEWEALLVTEGWTFNPKSVVFPVLVTLVLVAVMASRLVYGDWGTAWTAASCLAAVIATGLTWIHMITSR